jgi:carotenoid cleavage dioxygenase-like enzyme
MADGDGFILKVGFSQTGEIDVKTRFIPTEEFQREEKEQRIMYRGSYGTSQIQEASLKARIVKNVGECSSLCLYLRCGKSFIDNQSIFSNT